MQPLLFKNLKQLFKWWACFVSFGIIFFSWANKPENCFLHPSMRHFLLLWLQSFVQPPEKICDRLSACEFWREIYVTRLCNRCKKCLVAQYFKSSIRSLGVPVQNQHWNKSNTFSSCKWPSPFPILCAHVAKYRCAGHKMNVV